LLDVAHALGASAAAPPSINASRRPICTIMRP
jgi:hypothetical protein